MKSVTDGGVAGGQEHRSGRNPDGVGDDTRRKFPKVAAWPPQPWAMGHNPDGIEMGIVTNPNGIGSRQFRRGWVVTATI